MLFVLRKKKQLPCDAFRLLPLEVIVIPKLQGKEGYCKILHARHFHLCLHEKQQAETVSSSGIFFAEAAQHNLGYCMRFPLTEVSFHCNASHFPNEGRRTKQLSFIYKRISCVDCEVIGTSCVPPFGILRGPRGSTKESRGGVKKVPVP